MTAAQNNSSLHVAEMLPARRGLGRPPILICCVQRAFSPHYARSVAEIAVTDKSRSKGGQDRRAAAEGLAIAALAFIAGEPERLGRFLALTGIGPESIRAAAHEPRFLLGVLDHLAGEEPLLLAFAAENSIPPSAVMEARDTIAGRHWERDTP
jgi:hypothetical protein